VSQLAPSRPAPGVLVLPLRTPTLPPAEATNTIIIGPARGDGPRWVVDPATPHADERERLLEALAATSGLAGVALTHHHRDHAGAAAWLSRELGLPICAHGRTATLAGALGVALEVSRPLDEGDRLGDWAVLHTPGHASDHLTFVRRDEEEGDVAVVGDMVASVGSILIDPEDGHMPSYLRELRRLEALGLRCAIPSHGAPVAQPSALFAAYLRHRSERGARVLAALSDTPSAVSGLTAAAWSEVPPALWSLAARACVAHLVALMEEGLATPEIATESSSFGGRPWLHSSTMWRLTPRMA
jgi:ribonuclease/clavin/mitogillin